MRKLSASSLGYICIFAATILWSMLGTLIKILLKNGLYPAEIAFWRCLIAGGIFVVHGIICRHYRIRLVEALVFMLFGVICIGLMFACYYTAIEHGGVALSVVLMYTAPFWVAVLSYFIFKDRLGKPTIIALVFSVGGVTLLCSSGGGLPNSLNLLGIGCGVLSGFLYSLHFVLGRVYLGKLSAISIYMFALPAGALALFPFVEFAAERNVTAWITLIIKSVFSTYLAYILYCEALKRLAMTRVAIICNFEPMLAVIIAYIVWDELFTPVGWIGALLVCLAMFMVIFAKQDNRYG